MCSGTRLDPVVVAAPVAAVGVDAVRADDGVVDQALVERHCFQMAGLQLFP